MQFLLPHAMAWQKRGLGRLFRKWAHVVSIGLSKELTYYLWTRACFLKLQGGRKTPGSLLPLVAPLHIVVIFAKPSRLLVVAKKN